MSKLIVKSIDRAGKGLILSGDVECQVEVKRLAGRSSYTVLVDGVKSQDVSRATPLEMWRWLIAYFGVFSIEQPEIKPRKKTCK